MRFRTLSRLLCLPAILLGCGSGGESSGGPVEPSPPTGNAEIVTSSVVSFGLCTGAGCEYSQEYANTGTGCANNLHGKVRVYQDQTLLETDEWWLDSSLVIRPGESVAVEDCCFDRDSVQLTTRTQTETFWNNVPCA